MKKLLLFCLVTSCHLSVLYGQSFHRGAFVLGVNYGIDGNTADRNYFNSSEGNAQTLDGTAPASNLNATAELGLFKWLGIGLIGRYDTYFPQDNTLTHTSPSEKAFDIGLTGNLHIISISFLDLLAGVDYGFSRLILDNNNFANTTSASNGSWGDIHATGRLYFGRLGVNLTLYVPWMSYDNFKSTNTGAGEYVINDWKSSGYGASIGLQLRIL